MYDCNYKEWLKDKINEANEILNALKKLYKERLSL